MKRNKKIITVLSSVMLVAAVFFSVAIISAVNKRGFSYDDDNSFSYSVKDDTPQTSVTPKVKEETPPPQSNTATETEEETTVSETPEIDYSGTYSSLNKSVTVTSSADGYFEGVAVSGNISMNFGGQSVDNTVTATDLDNMGNNIKIIIKIIDKTTLEITTEPIVLADETQYLDINGILKKR